jgi:hypothetical protein
LTQLAGTPLTVVTGGRVSILSVRMRSAVSLPTPSSA